MIIIIIKVYNYFFFALMSLFAAHAQQLVSVLFYKRGGLSQETSDLAETSDHEMLASNGISSLWVVLDSSTESRSGGSRSL